MNRRLILTIAVAIFLVGCASATPGGSGALGGSGAPGRSAGSSPQAADPQAFANATCIAIDELSLAWGNPDTNVKSEAWKRFEAAIAARDTAKLTTAAAEILTHIKAAREANARGATWAPGSSANADFEAVLVALEAQVITVRDAAGDPAVATRAATTMQAAWPRFLVYLQKLQVLMQTKAAPITQLPCRGTGASASPS